MQRVFKITVAVFLTLIVALLSLRYVKLDKLNSQTEFFAKHPAKTYKSVDDVPKFDGEPFVIINDNKPCFEKDDLIAESFEEYSRSDKYGRAGVAYACVGTDIMPTEERGSLSNVLPKNWGVFKDVTVDGTKLFNKCHLIAFQLTGENANVFNIIPGTRYLNNEGMLPFENLVTEYIKSTENHVLYRVTPIYIGDSILAKGVQIEAMSVEDNGSGICFNVFVHNAYPGIEIDYKTGEITYLD